ncbi:MAG: hypothetical protein Q8R04_01950 [Nanoarchaeota archaeon]|nr:hypothetical protein [Nanoarchaeota archaeon]
MKIEIPKTIFGMEVKGALELALNQKDPLPAPAIKPAAGLEDYIHVPSINLYIAKQRTLQGKTWSDTHIELQSQNLRMPTIPEFIAFVKYLKHDYQNRAEADSILDDILTVRSPSRAEWLDADFKVVNIGGKGVLHINYNHKLVNGILQPQNSEPLEACLMKNCKVDLASFNKQGLPTKEGNDFSYWFPRSDNNSVAGFDADSDGACLYCYWNPRDSISALGVRRAKFFP